MEFFLSYIGPISTTAHAKMKMKLRREFSPQLSNLRDYLKERDVPYELGFQHENRRLVENFVFHPLVSVNSGKVIELKFTILTENEAGHHLTYNTGDIDNQLKVLLDGLRMPNNKNETREERPHADGEVLYCLMEDDSLVKKVEVENDKLLFPIPRSKGNRDIFVFIRVNVVPKFY